ncbi:MAG: hypothetical protein ABI321_16270 [Polyangia bacterium]
MIELRMKGLPVPLVLSAVVAASPLGYIGYAVYVKHFAVTGLLVGLAMLCALLPWLSRLAGRVASHAKIDDIALHAGGEAMPWNTITKIRVERTWRRTVLVIDRGRTARIKLVTHDLFAGRLEPLEALQRRLPKLDTPPT